MAVYLYVGTFCQTKEAGYSVYRFDPEYGQVTLVAERLFPEISAGTIVFDKKKDILYCTDERPGNPQFEQAGGGRIFALKLDPQTGLPEELNHALSYGSRPSFAALDKDCRHLVVTNFGASKHAGTAITQIYQDDYGNYHARASFDDATTVLYRLENDGSIGTACDVFFHRQEGEQHPRVPHAHCVRSSPDGKFFAVCEMGTDKIYMFSIDQENHKLLCPNGPYQYETGYGPRYCFFHPTKPFLFINTEDIPTVASFHYTSKGELSRICSVNVMPEGYEPTPELHSGFAMSADGRFLYSAMRKFNLINVLAINQEDGSLSRLQTVKLSGSHPKDCAISPCGRWLAVANRRSDNVEFFRVAEDGTLSAHDAIIRHEAAGVVFFLEL